MSLKTLPVFARRTLHSSSKLFKILKFATSLQYLRVIEKADAQTLGKFTRVNLTDLGTTFIKIGQLLSTRSDIFGEDFTKELEGLQDKIPSFDWTLYKESLPENVIDIDPIPIASASIGQVHKAGLKSGETVVVKLKRPEIQEEIETDFQMLLGFLAILREFFDQRELYELETIFNQYKTLLNEEVNFKREVSNMLKFKNIFRNTSWIRIPYPYQDISTNDIIVMEYLPAIKIDDISTLKSLKYNQSKIAEKLVECYIKQIVEYGIIHIDPHPGNVGITVEGQVVFYDYGMVTEINESLRENFEDLLMAVSEKDADTIAKIMIKSDIVTVEEENIVFLKTFVISFINYIETVDVDSFQKSFIDKISTNDLPFLVNSNFLLILRGITILEGICKKLDPDFNYKKIIDPYIMEFPVDIGYYEKRALKDIENLQKLALPQVLNSNQQNDLEKELMQQRLSKLQLEKDIIQKKQNNFTALFTISLITSIIGTNKADMEFIQIGMFCFALYSMFYKNK
jgi:predicted unusual protein kinase regulating ubiquinone biosynthesis (AarF/ABC1/UbiB family)